MQLYISSSHQRSFFIWYNFSIDYGFKREDNKIVTMLYDKMLYIYKTVKSSHLKKLQII